jgi:mannitol-1-phosphate/altronate dehydrogenase
MHPTFIASLAHAHIDELIADAERRRLARAVRQHQRRPTSDAGGRPVAAAVSQLRHRFHNPQRRPAAG